MAEKVLQSQGILHEDASVYVFRCAHAAEAQHAGPNVDRLLSPQGRLQAESLAEMLKKAEIDFDQIICSAAPRAQQTAAIVCADSKCYAWHMGKRLELYTPASIQDHAAIWKLTEQIEVMFAAKEIPSPMSYRMYRRADTTGLFNRFMDETRSVFAKIPGIGQKRHIAIFGHGVMNNAIVEAFFPQYVGELAAIELAPCDRIRVTKKICMHVPLSV